ncbi:uncharacterized protein A4U43_C06F4950 [Asparagus officinalis]|uniref:CCT domain-containing protein n=1 Tax=Asparagus officinalis TaxID=4686 RepID=A0A5P1EQ67_ASPOF|nr:uncharacterized protein A4U43_C06F4950 [Asparagus officinalis]
MICPKSQTVATVVGGKTARPCDSCVCRRARWYCAADDAFLCQNCDSSVHSANPLAQRHHRVRLQTIPVSKPVVPEIETSAEDTNNDEQLLYRVPIFDPVLAEFCSPPLAVDETSSETKPNVQLTDTNTKARNSNEILSGFLQSDAELADFAADMESLLGRGLDNGSFSMEELGLVDTSYSTPDESERVKEEYVENDADGSVKLYEEIDLSREALEINFDCCRSGDEHQEEMAETEAAVEGEVVSGEENQGGKKIGLILDYDAVALEWSAQGSSLSPWVNGERPQLGPGARWLDYMGMWGGGEVQGLVAGEIGGSHFDEGREARVSRYREKRRTRLFSKKIRYEVRKLNAEKRPRMKGRFVKRASFAAPAGIPAFKY